MVNESKVGQHMNDTRTLGEPKMNSLLILRSPNGMGKGCQLECCVEQAEEETNLPTANTVRATEEPSCWCVRSYSSGSNIPSQIMGAFQGVHVCTSFLDLE